MSHFEQDFLKPGTFGNKQKVTFTSKELVEITDNTNRMLKDGFKIPAFDQHAPINTKDGGPQAKATIRQMKAIDAKGWVKSVDIDESGKMSWVVDVKDKKYESALEDGIIRSSSPEIGSFTSEFTDSKGKSYGRVIRHAAFTAFPKNKEQSDFIALSDDENDCIQLGFNPCIAMGDHGDHESSHEDDTDTTPTTDNDTQKPADNMPVVTESSGDDPAIIAHLAELGVVLPVGFSFDGDNWKETLLAGLMTASKAKTDAKEVEKTEQTEPVEIEEVSPVSQLSEEDMTILDKMRAKLVKQQRATITTEIKGRKIPNGIRKKLLAGIETIQFDDDEKDETEFVEAPTYTLSEVAEMIEEAIPEGLATSASDMDEEEIGDSPGDELPKTDAEKVSSMTAEETQAHVDAQFNLKRKQPAAV